MPHSIGAIIVYRGQREHITARHSMCVNVE